MKTVRRLGWSVLGTLVLLPLIAMQFTEEVNWGLSDFLFAAVVLGGAGLLMEIATRTDHAATNKTAYAAGTLLAMLAAVSQLWVNAAVGIIGNESNDINLLFYGVVLIAVLGMIVSRFRPLGMKLSAGIAAALQAALMVAGLLSGWGADIWLTGAFLLLWLMSAVCFQAAMTG